MGRAAVLLIDPRFPHNVGNALRACALLGADTLGWTGNRVPSPEKWPPGARLPREERMRAYERTTMEHYESGVNLLTWSESEWTPVCVEIGEGAEDLRDFVHPENAIYVFGPEDGGVSKGVRHVCHRFVQIPNAIPDDDPDSRTPFNLAFAVGAVLYDRLFKQTRAEMYLPVGVIEIKEA